MVKETLIYLPPKSKKIQIAYCLEAVGVIEFVNVRINELKEGFFARIK